MKNLVNLRLYVDKENVIIIFKAHKRSLTMLIKRILQPQIKLIHYESLTD
jgi:hypothetical protein